MRRRALLRAAALLPIAAGGTGCAGLTDVVSLRPTVRVAVSWSAAELGAFRSVLDRIGSDDYTVQPIPLGDDISAALGARTTGRPDVVLLPRPGLVSEHLDDLEPLPAGAWRDQFATEWRRLLFHRDPSTGDPVPYGLPFKLAHKSSVWYRKDVFDDLGLEPPDTWTAWLDLNDRLIAHGVAPLALAGADGWMLTDFFENVLLGCAPDTYDALAARPPRPWERPGVGRALRVLGRMWSVKDALAGGARRSLVQQFPEAVVEVFHHHRAAMVVAPDFAESVVNRFLRAPARVGVFRFPVVDGGTEDAEVFPPLVTGVDIAVLPTPAGGNARDLVRRLARPDAPLPWIRRTGGFIAANRDVPRHVYSDQIEPLAEQLRSQPVRLDLSDQLGWVGSSEGLWRVLQDFLATVGDGGDGRVDDAAAEAVRRMRDVEDRAREQGTGASEEANAR